MPQKLPIYEKRKAERLVLAQVTSVPKQAKKNTAVPARSTQKTRRTYLERFNIHQRKQIDIGKKMISGSLKLSSDQPNTKKRVFRLLGIQPRSIDQTGPGQPFGPRGGGPSAEGVLSNPTSTPLFSPTFGPFLHPPSQKLRYFPATLWAAATKKKPH